MFDALEPGYSMFNYAAASVGLLVPFHAQEHSDHLKPSRTKVLFFRVISDGRSYLKSAKMTSDSGNFAHPAK